MSITNELLDMYYDILDLDNGRKAIRISYDKYDELRAEQKSKHHIDTCDLEGEIILRFMGIPMYPTRKEDVLEIVDVTETERFVFDFLKSIYGEDLRIKLVSGKVNWVAERTDNPLEIRQISICKPIGSTYYGYSKEAHTAYVQDF